MPGMEYQPRYSGASPGSHGKPPKSRPPRTTHPRVLEWANQQQLLQEEEAYYQYQQQHYNSQRTGPPAVGASHSTSFDSDNVSETAPTRTVHLHSGQQQTAQQTQQPFGGAYPLTRELSDLSGSYGGGGGTNSVTASGVPRTIGQVDGLGPQQAQNFTCRQWTQAKVLSSREPHHPQPPADCDDSVGFGDKFLPANCNNQKSIVHIAQSSTSNALAVIEQALGFEVVDDALREHTSTAKHGQVEYGAAQNGPELTIPSNSQLQQCHVRTPLLVVLMDPNRKMYELMQLWIDVQEDSVRDVLHAIQQKLSEGGPVGYGHGGSQWKQDYDGLFQVRNHHFSQLIHILNISKYDVQPNEVWVAKPWSMSAKATVNYAASLLQWLQRMGIVQSVNLGDYAKSASSSPSRSSWKFKSSSNANANTNDSILVLSKEAKKRIYVPGGILKHHHACQFLSFSPPFESAVPVDVLGCNQSIATSDGRGGDGASTHSNLTDSHFGIMSSMASTAVTESGHNTKGKNGSSTVSIKSNLSFSQLIRPRSFSPSKRMNSSRSNDRVPPPSSSASNFLKSGENCDAVDIMKHNQGPDGSNIIGGESSKNSDHEKKNKKSQARRKKSSLVEKLSMLNCGACKEKLREQNADQYGYPSRMDTTDTGMESLMLSSPAWRMGWEEESKAGESKSVISDSAPLLIANPPCDPDWIAEF